jgi:hypothetical protein
MALFEIGTEDGGEDVGGQFSHWGYQGVVVFDELGVLHPFICKCPYSFV